MQGQTNESLPPIVTIEVEHGTILDCLQEVRESILPEHIKKDKYVIWLRSLDALKGTKFPWWWYLNYSWFMMLRQRLRFYEMAIRHIGWQYEIANMGVANCIRMRRGENREKTIANLLACAKRAGKEVSYETIYAGLAHAAAVAYGQHRRDLEEAERLWRMWRSEVAAVEPWVKQVETLSWQAPSAAMLLVPWLTWSVTLGTRLEAELRSGGWHFREAPSMMSLFAKEEPVKLSAQAEEWPASAQTRSRESGSAARA
jgi:hypothetical protein